TPNKKNVDRAVPAGTGEPNAIDGYQEALHSNDAFDWLLMFYIDASDADLLSEKWSDKKLKEEFEASLMRRVPQRTPPLAPPAWPRIQVMVQINVPYGTCADPLAYGARYAIVGGDVSWPGTGRLKSPSERWGS